MRRADWTPDLVIAAIVIIGGGLMKAFGIDGEVWSAVILAVGWVFGKQFEKRHYRKQELDKE